MNEKIMQILKEHKGNSWSWNEHEAIKPDSENKILNVFLEKP